VRLSRVLVAASLALFSVFVLARPALASVTVTRATLANGLRVVVVRDPLAPVVSSILNYQAGPTSKRSTGKRMPSNT